MAGSNNASTSSDDLDSSVAIEFDSDKCVTPTRSEQFPVDVNLENFNKSFDNAYFPKYKELDDINIKLVEPNLNFEKVPDGQLIDHFAQPLQYDDYFIDSSPDLFEPEPTEIDDGFPDEPLCSSTQITSRKRPFNR